MTEDDRAMPPRDDGKRDSEPTRQGPKAAGPGNLHGIPPEDSPGDSALDLRPFAEGRPAKDPEEMARRTLRQSERGPKAQGDAGPLGVAQRGQEDDDGTA
jgi:hypothetical protein